MCIRLDSAHPTAARCAFPLSPADPVCMTRRWGGGVSFLGEFLERVHDLVILLPHVGAPRSRHLPLTNTD